MWDLGSEDGEGDHLFPVLAGALVASCALQPSLRWG